MIWPALSPFNRDLVEIVVSIVVSRFLADFPDLCSNGVHGVHGVHDVQAF